MKAPGWWWSPRPTLAATALAPLGAAYGALTAARMGRRSTRVNVPVVCVGNLVVGGAGKTPTAIALAALLRSMGATPAFLSRGYGRDAARGAAVIPVDPARHAAADVGDEPLLLAMEAPTFVATDRVAAARAAIAAGADVLVLDDGLQSPALGKDWTVAVVDGGAGIGNGLCLPAGPLRAPVERQWPSVSLVCIVGEGAAGDRLDIRARDAGKPVARARMTLDPAIVAELRGRRLLAFAGIGRPEKFFDSLRAAGLDVVGARAFPDHHRFDAADRDALVRAAIESGATLVTTSKDRVRLPKDFPVHAMPGRLDFGETGGIVAALMALRAVSRP